MCGWRPAATERLSFTLANRLSTLCGICRASCCSPFPCCDSLWLAWQVRLILIQRHGTSFSPLSWPLSPMTAPGGEAHISASEVPQEAVCCPWGSVAPISTSVLLPSDRTGSIKRSTRPPLPAQRWRRLSGFAWSINEPGQPPGAGHAGEDGWCRTAPCADPPEPLL